MTATQAYLHPGATNYPRQVNTNLGEDAPQCLAVWGRPTIWPITSNRILALVCSARAPAGILLAVHDLAQQWRHGPQAIVSGFHSPVEQEALEILLREPGRTIYCPARGLPKRLKPGWQSAMDAGRLTILSPFPDSVRRATRETAIYRNRFVAALADVVLIAYAHPGSSTEQLAQEVLGWGKPVYTLAHESNAPLQEMGAKAVHE
jgi:predicted Rossmann fold nucleotide-binding protein DprA/Smf involved in DNA uptake